MNKNDRQFTVQRIRTQYTEQRTGELDALKALDAKVKRPANIFAYAFGSLAAIVMGTGMSLVMTDLGATLGMANAMVPGIILGVVGMAMAIVNYPIFKRLLGSRKSRYADEIIAMSDRLIGERE